METDTPNPQEQYQVLMGGNWIVVPFSSRPDFDARQFWIDVASTFNRSDSSDETGKMYGEEFDKYAASPNSHGEIRPGSGIYAMFINEGDKGIKQIVVQNRNGMGNQKLNDTMRAVVETALTPKPII